MFWVQNIIKLLQLNARALEHDVHHFEKWHDRAQLDVWFSQASHELVVVVKMRSQRNDMHSLQHFSPHSHLLSHIDSAPYIHATLRNETFQYDLSQNEWCASIWDVEWQDHSIARKTLAQVSTTTLYESRYISILQFLSYELLLLDISKPWVGLFLHVSTSLSQHANDSSHGVSFDRHELCFVSKQLRCIAWHVSSHRPIFVPVVFEHEVSDSTIIDYDIDIKSNFALQSTTYHNTKTSS